MWIKRFVVFICFAVMLVGYGSSENAPDEIKTSSEVVPEQTDHIVNEDSDVNRPSYLQTLKNMSWHLADTEDKFLNPIE